jgi:four helix bundle protein
LAKGNRSLRIGLPGVCCFSKPRDLRLTSQIRRAAVSVPSNIAEGTGRITRGEYVQSVGYARGSLLEIETQLIIAQRLGYLGSQETDKLLEVTSEIGRVANGLIRALSRSASS